MLKKVKIIKSLKQRLLNLITQIRRLIFHSEKGSLSWYLVFKIAFKNLLVSPSRTFVTVSAIAVGTSVLVILISFAYGLQNIVTKRLIQPNSLRLADIQTSSTAVSLTTDKIKEIKKIPGVEKIAAAVSLVGSLNFKESKMDVIVLGADNFFLDFSHTQLLYGQFFSKKAEEKYYGKTDLEDLISKLEEGQVAGVGSEKQSLKIGDEISSQKVYFRLNEETYYPLRETPKMTGKILGYVQGSFLKNETGIEIWGGVYESVSTVGKFYQDRDGNWYGKWIKTKMPIYQEVSAGLYLPATDENGSQRKEEGYLAEKDIKILSQEEIILEKQINQLMNKFSASEEGMVLGEATEEANITALSLEKDTTQTAELKAIIEKEKQKQQATAEAQLAIVEVKKKGGKEILLSTSILNLLKLKPNQILGKTISLAYIVSGNLIPKVSGRVISKSVDYNVVGIIKEDKNLLAITPLSDLESMGVSRYSMGKVLAKNEENLKNVREKIETLGFNTLSIVDTLAQVNRLFRLMKFLLGAFGTIALVVAVLGMFNTLTVSLLERTREVAVMKTLGTKDYDIGRLFLAESVIIGFLGGIFGIFLGENVGETINFVTSFFRDDKTVKLFVTPFYFSILILFLSVAIGIFTGLYPSKRAKNISPLEALRYE